MKGPGVDDVARLSENQCGMETSQVVDSTCLFIPVEREPMWDGNLIAFYAPETKRRVEREPMWDGNTGRQLDQSPTCTVEREPMWDGNMSQVKTDDGVVSVEREQMWDGNIGVI